MTPEEEKELVRERPGDDAEEAGPVEVSGGDGQRRRVAGLPSWLAIATVFLALCGGLAWLLLGTGGSDAFAYSKLVDEVVTDPQAFADRELRVEGDLREGSIRFREDPCEWRFVLTKGGEEMPVQFPQCVVPDTFRDGMGISVVVQGRIQGDGTFIANQVVPRCPSKYEMRQRQENGEEVPHEMEPPTAAAEPS